MHYFQATYTASLTLILQTIGLARSTFHYREKGTTARYRPCYWSWPRAYSGRGFDAYYQQIRRQNLAGYYYANKQEFWDAIDWLIDEVNHGEYENELRTLLAPNFQTLKRSPGFSHPVAA